MLLLLTRDPHDPVCLWRLFSGLVRAHQFDGVRESYLPDRVEINQEENHRENDHRHDDRRHRNREGVSGRNFALS